MNTHERRRGFFESPHPPVLMHGVGEGAPKVIRPSPTPPGEAKRQESFSTLDLRDRVVIMAIFYEIVQVDHVEEAWKHWKTMQQHGSDEALWRVLVRNPEVNREAIYEVAAQIYSFEEADINRLRAQTLIRELSTKFSEAQWKRMFEMLVAPIAVGEDPRSGHARLIFATHDPTRPEVTRLLQSLKLNSFELRYAGPAKITELFTEIFGSEIKQHLFLHEEALVAPAGVETVPEPVAEEAAADKPHELNPSSFVDWFESVLIATYHERATEAHLFINEERELEIHICVAGLLSLWRKEDTLHPEGLLAFVMDKIIKVENFDPSIPMEISFQRWIDRDLARFHIRIHPSDESKELSAATVVIRVLGHRETSSEGMGPWKSH